jgi:N-acetyl-alpha-D-muramate 1-phosphate uridylyltransferase
MSLPVAILAGGLATRLGPISERTPKSLVDVAGRPFAAHQIELLRRHGLCDIVFLVGHLGEMVRDRLGDGSRWGVRLQFVFDGPARLGTGGAIRRALPWLGDSFFVLYGDSYLECDYAAVERAFLDSGRAGLMTVFRNDGRWDVCNVQFEGGRVVRYDKAHRVDEMRHIDYGLGAFRREAFSGWHDEVFDLEIVYRELLARDDLAGFEVPSRFYEVGSLRGLEETRAHLRGKGSSGR